MNKELKKNKYNEKEKTGATLLYRVSTVRTLRQKVCNQGCLSYKKTKILFLLFIPILFITEI